MIDRSEIDTAEFPLGLADAPRVSSSRVHIDVAALTDIGKARSSNEDHYFVARCGRKLETLHTNVPSEDVPAEFTETGYVMIVADGMGGAAGGEVASRLAIATLINIIIHVPDWILRLDKNVRAEIHRLKLVDRDRLLLCTDGLTDMVDDAGIAVILAGETGSDETCRLLVERANEQGGKDNITVVLARYTIPAGVEE